ncbi:MAG: hypothetical protein [Siphoviridae sp. ctpQM7]|nr:MAG: hypothetical protein [Siphoviridae sp. ctpQM7]
MEINDVEIHHRHEELRGEGEGEEEQEAGETERGHRSGIHASRRDPACFQPRQNV